MKQIVYIDMDNVLVDFKTGIDKLNDDIKLEYQNCLDNVPGIFSLMEPMPFIKESINTLAQYYDLYILSTAPWLNPTAWSDKLK